MSEFKEHSNEILFFDHISVDISKLNAKLRVADPSTLSLKKTMTKYNHDSLHSTLHRCISIHNKKEKKSSKKVASSATMQCT